MLQVLEVEGDDLVSSSSPRVLSRENSSRKSRSKSSSKSRSNSHQRSVPSDFSPRSPPIINGSISGLSPVENAGSVKNQPPPSSPPFHVLVAGGGPILPHTNDGTKENEVRTGQKSVIPTVIKDSVSESIHTPSIHQPATTTSNKNNNFLRTVLPGVSNDNDNDINGIDDSTPPKSSARVVSDSAPLVTAIEQSSPLPDASPHVVAQKPPRKKERQLISSGKGITANGPRYNVLVVDDSAMSRKVTRHTLL